VRERRPVELIQIITESNLRESIRYFRRYRAHGAKDEFGI
jgi:hypothetical protein